MSPDTCRRVYLAQIDAMHKTPDRPSRKHTSRRCRHRFKTAGRLLVVACRAHALGQARHGWRGPRDTRETAQRAAFPPRGGHASPASSPTSAQPHPTMIRASATRHATSLQALRSNAYGAAHRHGGAWYPTGDGHGCVPTPGRC